MICHPFVTLFFCMAGLHGPAGGSDACRTVKDKVQTDSECAGASRTISCSRRGGKLFLTLRRSREAIAHWGMPGGLGGAPPAAAARWTAPTTFPGSGDKGLRLKPRPVKMCSQL